MERWYVELPAYRIVVLSDLGDIEPYHHCNAIWRRSVGGCFRGVVQTCLAGCQGTSLTSWLCLEMFACFGLKRMDVFSTGDLGVQ